MTKYEPRGFAISGTIHGPAFIGAEELVEFLNRGLAQATSGAAVDLEAARFDDATEPDDAERYYLTCDGISGLPCKEHGTDCRGSRAKDDLYVEPEPLKEGDWCLVWGRVEDVAEDGQIQVGIAVGHLRFPGAYPYIEPDAIVRPDAGRVPPWVKPPQCTSLHEQGHYLVRCTALGSHENHRDGLAETWTDAEAYGRVEVVS